MFVPALDSDCWAAAEIKCSCCSGEGLSLQVCAQISCFVSNEELLFCPSQLGLGKSLDLGCSAGPALGHLMADSDSSMGDS